VELEFQREVNCPPGVYLRRSLPAEVFHFLGATVIWALSLTLDCLSLSDTGWVNLTADDSSACAAHIAAHATQDRTVAVADPVVATRGIEVPCDHTIAADPPTRWPRRQSSHPLLLSHFRSQIMFLRQR
jgi:hypothetical protein